MMLRLSKKAAAILALVGGFCYLSGAASQQLARNRDGIADASTMDGYERPSAVLQDAYLPGRVPETATELTSVSQEKAVIMPRVGGVKTLLLAALIVVFLSLVEYVGEGKDKRIPPAVVDLANKLEDKWSEWPDRNIGTAKMFMLVAPVVLLISGMVDLLTSLARRREARRGKLTPPPFKGLEFFLMGAALLASYFIMDNKMIEAAVALMLSGAWKMFSSTLSRRKFDKQMKELMEEARGATSPQ